MERQATYLHGPSKQAIDRDFPFLKDHTYFNSASCSPCPEPVLSAMVDFYRNNPVNYRSGQTPAEERVTTLVDAVRKNLARFLGATSAGEVVFTRNTTEAINMVARGLDWEPGDEIVASPIEHQSNLIPWMNAAHENRLVLKYVMPDESGFIDPASLGAVVSEKTRLVSIHHVSNLLGVQQDLAALAAIAHDHGALFLADAAQSEGRIEVNVQEIGCDFLASCARKGLMGPQGVGFLWGKEQHMRELSPLTLGSQAATATGPTSYDLADMPFRHESGILNTAGLIGLGAALEYVEKIGVSNIEPYVQSLMNDLHSLLLSMDGVEIYGPQTSDRVGVISWNVQGKDAGLVAKELYESQRISVSAGSCGSPLALEFLGVPSVVRTSLHYFNRLEDIDRLAEGLKEIT